MGAQAVRLSNVDIDNALKNKDFEVLFQPVFDLGNGALARVETFVRWRHPKLGLLPPGAFISFFESQGRMSELTRYVLASSLRAYMDWRGPWPPGLSVNLALSDLSDEAFTSHFTKLLRDLDFPADLVTLECPMPPLDMTPDVALSHFQRLSETGARLAIEVRGRANDLLRSLDPFPFDEIKTGGSAILRFARTVRGPGLSAIADLLDVANDANAAITAVGVEDQASLAALRGLGFTAAQGNHLGKVGELKEFRPHRINEVRELLELEPLSQENLAALFRTESPAAQSAEVASSTKESNAEGRSEDALLDRLNERVAQFETPEDEIDAGQTATAQTTETPSEDEKKAKAREKAKALAMAKRAKARAARKNAAIERAKTKAAARPVDENTAFPATAPAPRDMQDRLSKAFTPEEEPAAEPPITDDVAEGTIPERVGSNAPAPITPEAEQEQATPTSEELFPSQPVPEEAESNIEERTEIGTPVFITRDEIAPQQTPSQQTATGQTPSAQPSTQAEQASTIERAMAQQNQSHAAATATAADPVSLAVGASGAYFQPGIRVGAPALPPLEQSDFNTSQSDADRRAERSVGPTIGPSAPETGLESEAPPAQPQMDSTPSTTPSDEKLGDLHSTTPDTETAIRRRKPFLKRTVIPVSRHFWPRTWRRAWKRRAAARAAEARAQELQRQAAE